MAEAQRMFWRQTVLPLVERTAKTLSMWLAPAYGEALQLKPDLDQLPALATERESLWTQLEKASFLTTDEKRAAAGYGPLTGNIEPKFRLDQPRVPSGQPGGGQWTEGDGGIGSQTEIEPGDYCQPLIQQVAKKPGGGGIAKELWNLTVRKFVSDYCKGSIDTVMPGEFDDMTIAEVLDLAKGGDARARRCKKLLEQRRFRKDTK